MSNLEREYRIIFSYLQSLNFHFLDTWVRECVDYYKTTKPNIPIEVLKNEVKKQWLLVNLRDIKVPSLPPNLVNSEKIILNGKYAVQVESMVDCSESYYSQIQRVQKIVVDEIDDTKGAEKKWNCKSKRCLTFDLCDGVQEIRAMEYKPISKIRTNDPELLPGFKMIIIGPVECRKGMILLKEENVKVWGGEVDSIAKTNNLKSILLKKLDLGEADFSESDPDSDMTENLQSTNEVSPVIEDEPTNCAEENVETLLSQNNDLFLSLPLESDLFVQETNNSQEKKLETLRTLNNTTKESEIKNNVSHFNNENNLNETCRDNVFHDIFLTFNKKHCLSNENLNQPYEKRRNFDIPLCMDHLSPEKKNGFLNNIMDDTVQNKELKDGSSDQLKNIKLNQNIKTIGSVQTNLLSFFVNQDSAESNITNCSKKAVKSEKCILISHKPFVYLKQIMATKLNAPSVFTIKGVILTLKNKISIAHDEYNLKATVTDGSLSVDVDFSSSVLETLLGYSPCEMSAMIKTKQTNSAIANRIKEAFHKAQAKLISLNCLMDVKVFTDNKCPLILSLKEVTVQHLNELKERLIKP